MITQNTETFAEIITPTNPFPGLRPFDFDESHLFFGRDGQSEQLVSKLGRTRFLAVVGSSGSGKSSLVRAGLLPALLGGFMTSAGSDWRIAILRPGNDPVGNLARALNATDVFGSEIDENASIQTAIAEANLRRGGRGLVEAVRQNAMPDNENLLVLVDQFEELFRFAREASRKTKDESERYQNDAAAFVKLLLEAHSQREANIYVVLTMRSDFLGDCAQFWDLPETVNESQYLTPRLTRDQLREAITGPVAVGGGEITQRLVNRLLNDVGDNQDQLPVLQHLLMRAWDEWKEKRLEVEVKEGEGTVRRPHRAVHEGEAIDLCCYEAVGGMAEALSRHADEAFNELPDDRHREVAEKLFKALTEKGPDNREIRRPIMLGEICAVTHVAISEVITVVDTFRLPGRSFLMPPAGAALNSESLIDISHESLIRGWERLRNWVEEEVRSARIYRRLAETAELHREGRAGLWGDPDLQLALDWQEKNHPNKDWARRYYPGFETAIAFLQASEQKRADDVDDRERQQREAAERTRRELEQAQALAEAEQQRAEAERQKVKEQQQRIEDQARATSRLRRLLVALAVGALLAMAFGVFAFAAQQRAKAASERSRRFFYVANMNLAQKAFEDGDPVRAQELLDAFLPTSASPKSDDVRGFDWYYLWRHNYRETAALEGHGAPVRSLAFSPDSKTLATGSDDKTVKLWDVNTRQELATLGHANSVNSVAFSPDSKTLATGRDDNTLKLWDVNARQDLATLKGHTQAVLSVAFSTDGKNLATGSVDNKVKLWDVSARKELATLTGHTGWVVSVAFSPNGKTLASGSHDATVKLWDVSTRKELATLKGHFYSVSSVAFSPDGKTLATGSKDHTVKLWDVGSRKELATLKGHTKEVLSVAFSPDGKTLATGSEDHTVKLWDVSTRQELTPLTRHESSVSSVALSPDGKTLATGSGVNTLTLWDVSSRQELATFKGHTSFVFSVAFSPDGKTLATGSRDNTVKLWDVSSRRELETLKGHTDCVFSVAFSPDGKTLAAGSADLTVKLWDVSTRQELATLRGHMDDVLSVAFSADGETLASGSEDTTVKLWDVSTRKELATLKGHTKLVHEVAFSPDGKTLATVSKDNTVKLWNVSTREELATLKGHTKEVLSVSFSPDGKTLATGSEDHTVKLWDVSTQQELATLKGHASLVSSLAFSADGKTLVTGSADNTVMLWFAATDEEVAAPRSK